MSNSIANLQQYQIFLKDQYQRKYLLKENLLFTDQNLGKIASDIMQKNSLIFKEFNLDILIVQQQPLGSDALSTLQRQNINLAQNLKFKNQQFQH
jgi:hypothetical protein